jgi:hypothetical protein
MKFPVFSLLAGNLASETSSLLTAPSREESANHRFLSYGRGFYGGYGRGFYGGYGGFYPGYYGYGYSPFCYYCY